MQLESATPHYFSTRTAFSAAVQHIVQDDEHALRGAHLVKHRIVDPHFGVAPAQITRAAIRAGLRESVSVLQSLRDGDRVRLQGDVQS
jgi:hypothetical protein